MTFFKKYNGTKHTGLMRLETLVWVLIYGGLLTFVVGMFMSRGEDGAGFELMLVGGIVAVSGVLLIYLRSWLHE
ncbi:MAG: hypothetical protein ABI343_03090 [Burkholderiaceae bacterium]